MTGEFSIMARLSDFPLDGQRGSPDVSSVQWQAKAEVAVAG